MSKLSCSMMCIMCLFILAACGAGQEPADTPVKGVTQARPTLTIEPGPPASPTPAPTDTRLPTATATNPHAGQFVVNTFKPKQPATIYFMDAKQGVPVVLTDEKSNNWGPNWSPDGMKIFFGSDRDGQHELYSMNADGSSQTRLTHSEVDKLNLRLSPDGKKIAFVDQVIPEGPPPAIASLYVVNADGTGMVKVADRMVYPNNIKWSPDSQRLAFLRPGEHADELMIVNSDGSGLKSLAGPDFSAGIFCFSPDGRQVAFGHYDGVRKVRQIYIVDAEGGPPRLLVEPGMGAIAEPVRPMWTSNNHILFVDLVDNPAEFYVDGKLYRIDPDGQNLVELAGDRKIRWVIGPSADGSQVALVVVLGQGEDYSMEVQVMNIDGSEARLVTDMGYYFDSANWSPDGQYFDIFGYLNNQAHSVDARLWIVSLDGSVQTDIRQYFDLPNVVWRP